MKRTLLIIWALLSFSFVAQGSESFARLCTERGGEAVRQGKKLRCQCMISKQFVNPVLNECFTEAKCRLNSGGKVQGGACYCPLNEQRGFEAIVNPIKNQRCQEDLRCRDELFGKVTKRGCECFDGSLAHGRQCRLLTSISRSCPAKAADLIRPIESVRGLKSEKKYFYERMIQDVSMPSRWSDLRDAILNFPEMKENHKELAYLKRWHEAKGYAEGPTARLNTLKAIPYLCENGDGHLYPVHPYQSTKIYHLYDKAYLKERLVPADSELCKISNRHKNPEKRICLSSSPYHFFILSDLYQDSCGNIYRAFFSHGFSEASENMGDLFAPGRTQYIENTPGLSKKVILSYTGGTYSKNIKEALFLAEPFDGDKERYQRERAKALYSNSFDLECGLFKRTDR